MAHNMVLRSKRVRLYIVGNAAESFLIIIGVIRGIWCQMIHPINHLIVTREEPILNVTTKLPQFRILAQTTTNLVEIVVT
jgi:hypothetical protein